MNAFLPVQGLVRIKAQVLLSQTEVLVECITKTDEEAEVSTANVTKRYTLHNDINKHSLNDEYSKFIKEETYFLPHF